MSDKHFVRSDAMDILTKFMRREYDASGLGGLFALRYPKEDMRDIEIWYQMMSYLEEDEQ